MWSLRTKWTKLKHTHRYRENWGLTDERVVDGQMNSWAQRLLRHLSGIYIASILKIHAFNMDCGSPHFPVSKWSGDCPFGGWQTPSWVRTWPLCRTPSLEKEYSPSGLIKISVEWKQRRYVSSKWINLRRVLWESWIQISPLEPKLTHFLHKRERNISSYLWRNRLLYPVNKSLS